MQDALALFYTFSVHLSPNLRGTYKKYLIYSTVSSERRAYIVRL